MRPDNSEVTGVCAQKAKCERREKKQESRQENRANEARACEEEEKVENKREEERARVSEWGRRG